MTCSERYVARCKRCILRQVDLEQPFDESGLDDVFFTLAEEIDEITAPHPVQCQEESR